MRNAESGTPNDFALHPVFRIWWQWFLLLGVVVILPLTVSLAFFRQVIEENTNMQFNNRHHDLEKTARSLGNSLKAANILQNLVTRIVESDPKLRNHFFLDCARRYPGAFLIARWNNERKLLTVPPNLAFPSHIRLQELVHVLSHGDLAFEAFEKLMENREKGIGLQSFQRFLGPTLSLKDFLRKFHSILEFQRNGISTFLFFCCFGNSNAGFLQCVDSKKLPKEFYIKKAIQWNVTKTSFSLAFLDSRNEKNSCFSQDLPQTLGFARRLKRANARKTTSAFLVDDFLATEIPMELGVGQKVFLLVNCSDIRDEKDRFAFAVATLSGLLFLLGTMVFVLVQRGWGRNLSLAWRIATLLIIAIIIPFVGAFWAGTSAVRELEKQDYQKMYLSLSSKAFLLTSRYQSFLTRFGVALRQRLLKVAKNARDEKDLIRHLQKMSKPGQRFYAKTGPFSAFFLSDGKGNLKYDSTLGQFDGLLFIKIALRRAFWENIEAGNTSAGVLGEAIVEEFAGSGTKSGGQKDFSLPINTLSATRYSHSEITLLPMVLKVEKQPRILLIHMNRGLLEQYFIRSELLDGSAAHLRHADEGGIQSYFNNLRDEYQNFSDERDAPILSVPDLEVRFFDHWAQEVFGQFVWSGEPYVYYMAPRSLFRDYRFLALTSVTPLQKESTRRERLLQAWFLGVFAIAFFIGSILTRRILQPMSRLDSALGKIRAGDLSICLPAMGQDEIGQVGENVNLMVGELREKERLQAYLSETTLQAVKDGSADQDLEAQWKEVTIFFSDIRGFTTLSEQHPPEALFSGLNEFFETVDFHIRNSGGQIQKFVGDAAYAVFPHEGRVGAMGAVSAALAIMDFLTQFNQRRQASGLFSIAIGIGINTGNVLLGKVGSVARKDFAYIGDEVNVASSLETASKGGRFTRILISRSTYALIKTQVAVEEIEIPATLQALLTPPIFEIRERRENDSDGQ
jgi:class 3 adenylate cyclase